MIHAPAITPLVWRREALSILDQRLLPHREVWIEARTMDDIAEAISGMAVRGAPAIGIAAGYGVALAARSAAAAGTDPLAAARDAADRLARTRPTAVNLRWALDRMLRVAAATASGVVAIRLEAEAVAIHAEDIEANRRIGLLGRELLGASTTVLTHCNAGALATGGYGTALGVIRAAVEGGSHVAVFADETRPYLQGARLTAWELARDGIDVTLITDGMAGHFFRQRTFDAVIVGADRIAANGDTANKIGTYTLAILASHHGVPFYVAAPTSTIDLTAPDGSAIPIEERGADEVMEATGLDEGGRMATVRLAPAGVAARHPAFDVTPGELITAIVTERGIARAPYGESLRMVAG